MPSPKIWVYALSRKRSTGDPTIEIQGACITKEKALRHAELWLKQSLRVFHKFKSAATVNLTGDPRWTYERTEATPDVVKIRMKSKDGWNVVMKISEEMLV